MNKIEIVDVYHSKISHLSGIDIGPGFAVIVDPHPASDENIIRVTQAIRNALDGLKLDEDFIDPSTGEALRDVLFKLNGIPKEPVPAQIIRWGD